MTTRKRDESLAGEQADQRLAGDLGVAAQAIGEALGLAAPPELIVVSKWNTLLNLVLQVRIAGQAERGDLYVKVGRSPSDREGLQTEAENIRLFRRFFADSGGTFASVELVAYRPDRDLLIVNASSGESLLEGIKMSCRWQSSKRGLASVVARARACGRWVSHLERASEGTADPQQVYEQLVSAAAVAEKDIRALGKLASWQAQVRSCVEAVRSIRDGLPARTCMAHGDLHAENIFVTNDPNPTVTAIDLRKVAPQFAGYDALLFEHQLRYSFPLTRFQPSRIRQVLAGFWAGYGGAPDHSPVTHGLRAFFVLSSLVYLSTLAQASRWPWRLLYHLDAARMKT